ncbi:MAG TPA: hypothetical protein PLJ35_17850 [Anaerolineae bacterium]|nr:hypothetical protein [Anaerolineae bacterium]HOR00680.1 hypothetical protein [Anaerolineae bacterium]HPL30704.1 hypothetical protein [Anaerolineae bacterium]
MDAILQRTAGFRGTATRPGFAYYKFEFRPHDRANWSFLARFEQPVSDGVLMEWDTTTVPPGVYWLRLVVVDNTGNYWPDYAQVRVTVAR